MSKLGKKPINIPEGVEVKVDASSISVKGPKGTLTRSIPSTVAISVSGSEVIVKPNSTAKDIKSFWGLYRSLVQNMITGTSKGFEKTLEFQGVGYKATVKGKDLELGLGFSHPVTIHAPEGITFKTEKSSIKIEGIDKELIGKVATEIRSYREPEPYKGSGIRYEGEIIKRKAGKKAVASG